MKFKPPYISQRLSYFGPVYAVSAAAVALVTATVPGAAVGACVWLLLESAGVCAGV
jgi:hypothetical protein